MNNAELSWILFYIAAGILGIFLALVYLVSKKAGKKSR